MSDLNSAAINQMVIHCMASADYPAQVAKAIAHYRRRRDAMLPALERHMPPGVTWTRPQGGLFVWLTLPAGIDTRALLKRSVAEARVAFVPGAAFFAGDTGHNTIRLSYSLPTEAEIAQGIERLAALIKTALAA
jgi:DNA-binding transcriptional MocR family regulator